MPDEAIDVALAAETEEETVDGVPVLAEVRPLERSTPSMSPAIQAAAAAATGFVAGAATIALVRRHNARKLVKRHDARKLVKRHDARKLTRSQPVDIRPRRTEMLPILSTRTYLVDVHLIAKPGD
jgi:hypothetical protein